MRSSQVGGMEGLIVKEFDFGLDWNTYENREERWAARAGFKWPIMVSSTTKSTNFVFVEEEEVFELQLSIRNWMDERVMEEMSEKARTFVVADERRSIIEVLLNCIAVHVYNIMLNSL